MQDISASPSTVGPLREDQFRTTLWSRVRLAQWSDGSDGANALEALFRVYWPPVYAFLRRCGHPEEDAKDLTQDFFAYVIRTDLLKKADPDRGKFRSFLLGCLKMFVSNQGAKARAAKRGGGVQHVRIEPESECAIAEAATLTPERAFERKWALAVLNEGMRRLEREYVRAGAAREFEVLRPWLTGHAEEHLPAAAARLEKSPGAVRVLMFRMRNRYRRLVRSVIADTVTDESQVESELRYLEAALRAG